MVGKKRQNQKLFQMFGELLSPFMVITLVLMPIGPSFAKDKAKKEKTTDSKTKSDRADFATMTASNVMQIIQEGATTYANLQQQQRKQADLMLQQMQIDRTLEVIKFPDDIFPECQLAPAVLPKMLNMCPRGAALTDEMEANAILLYITKIQQAQNEYDLLSQEGLKTEQCTVTSCGEGVKCLDTRKKDMMNQLHNEELEIQILIKKIQQENKIFEQDANKRQEEIANIQSELDGKQHPKATENLKHKNFSALFADSNCKAAVNMSGKSGIKMGIDQIGGLRGMQKNIEQDNKVENATTLIAEEKSITSNIRKNAKDLANHLSSNQPSKNDITKYSKSSKGMQKVITDQYVDYQETTSEIDRDFKKILSGNVSNIPSLSNNSNDDNQKLLKTIKTSWEKEIIGNCMSSNEGMDFETLVSSITQEGTGSNVGTVQNFQQKLRKIYRMYQNDEMTTQQYVDAVNSLDSKEGRSLHSTARLAWKGRTADHNWKVSELISETYKHCETRYKKGKSNSDSSETMSSSIDRALKKIKDYNQVQSNFPAKVQSTILDKLINCKGMDQDYPYPAQPLPQHCNSKKLDKNGDQFCVKQSFDCAKRIQNCHAQTENIVRTREAQMRDMGAAYNEGVKRYKAAQNILMQDIENKFLQRVQFWKNKTQGLQLGAEFELPKSDYDMAKQEKIGEFEVALTDTAGFTKNLEKNLESIKNNLTAQRASIEGKINEHISKVKAAYQKQKAHLNQEAVACNQLIQGFNQSQQQAFEENQKQYSEDMENLSAFCDDVAMANGGVDADVAKDLGESMGKVAYMLNPRDKELISQYRHYGARQNNDSETFDEIEIINKYCSKDEQSDDDDCTKLKTYLDENPVGKNCSKSSDDTNSECITTTTADLLTNIRIKFSKLLRSARADQENPMETGQMNISACAGQYGSTRGAPGTFATDFLETLKKLDFSGGQSQ